MAIDYKVQSTYLNVFQVIFCLFCAIFLLILIRPLYNFSKERTAIYFFISPIANVLTFSIYIHIIALALNRFHAKKSNIKYIIFVIWIIILFWSSVQFIGYKLAISQTGFFSIFTYGIFMYADLPLLMSIFICTSIYTAVLAKFVYDY
ncbi:hypothetical protein Mgra_00003831, partial [Meloidogyne graminicola]